MRIFEMVDDNGGYDPQHDKMTALAPKQARPQSAFGRKIIIACWIGMALAAMAAINLALGRPWF